MHSKIIFFGVLLALAEAALGQSVPSESPASSDAAEPPTADSSYRLSVGDEVAITVFGEASLSKSELISRTGQVRLPMVGEVKVAGLTVRDAERLIEQTYISEEYLRAPQVSIQVAGYSLREVLVNGAVRSPGAYRFPPDTASIDIRDLILRLGGLSPVAKGDSVTVTTRAEDGTETTRTVNVDRLLAGRGRDVGSEILIYPGDRIFVPERVF